MSFFLQHKHDNLWHGKFALFSEDVAVHAISTRLGGVSEAPYASLNLGLHVGDDKQKVWENRMRFAASLELKAEEICTPQQVHGSHVQQVTERDAGRGCREYEDALPETDALITDVPGLPLMLCFADCTPILFLDPEKKAVGIAHGGWKGTVNKIACQTLAAMGKAFGTLPEECLVGIGPSIGPCCYEVGSEVEQAFREAFPAFQERILSQKDGKTHLNLWEANRQQLLAAGILPENMECAEACTACENQWYFSHRAEHGRTGRIAAMIALQKY